MRMKSEFFLFYNLYAKYEKILSISKRRAFLNKEYTEKIVDLWVEGSVMEELKIKYRPIAVYILYHQMFSGRFRRYL